jgi:hypothetical protein
MALHLGHLEWWATGQLKSGAVSGRSLPNLRMQPTGRKCPELRSGASSLEDEAERRFVRTPAREPAADAHVVRPTHGSSSPVRRVAPSAG